MRTTAIKFAFVAIMMMTISIFSVSAQETSFFFDKKINTEGKMYSRIKYELQDSGLFGHTYKSEYSYDASGKLVKEEGFKWCDKNSEWKPLYYLNHTYDFYTNKTILEYATWNNKENKFNDVSEKAIYWMNESGKVISWLLHGNNENIYTQFTLLANFQIKD